MINNIRVGIPFVGHPNWMGGVYYAVNLIKALWRLPVHSRPKLSLIVTPQYAKYIDLYAEVLPMLHSVLAGGDGWEIPGLEGRAVRLRSAKDLTDNVDVLFPVTNNVQLDFPGITWIPDFQHKYMPELFSEKERKERDESYARVAEHAKLMVLSSHSAHDDWRKFYPGAKAAVRILHFHTMPADDWYATDPAATAIKYKLPQKFLICCNQFWMHKNHGTLFNAMGLLQKMGVDLHLVCTGNTDEYRNREYFPGLQKGIADMGLTEKIHILGQIPRNEQIALMRMSMAVVQPSLFEGWSTVVEDSRLLGKKIFMSDIDVHKEQAPEFGQYFRRKDPAHLAELIAAAMGTMTSGPDLELEKKSRLEGDQRIIEYAENFSRIVCESQYVFGTRIANLPQSASRLLGSRLEVAKMPKAAVKDDLDIEYSSDDGEFVSDADSSGAAANVSPAGPAAATRDFSMEYQKVYQSLKGGNIDLAVKTLNGILEACPVDARAHNDLGFIYSRQSLDLRNRAFSRLMNAFAIDPRNPQPRSNLAAFLLDIGKIDEAMEVFRQTLELFPDDADAREKLDKLRSEYSEESHSGPRQRSSGFKIPTLDSSAAKSASDCDSPEYKQAQLLLEVGKIDQATELLEKLIRTMPGQQSANNDLGILHFQGYKQLRELAITHMQQSIRLDAGKTVAMKNLAAFLEETGDAKGAVELYRKIVQRDPDDGQMRTKLAAMQSLATQTTASA